jgi:integrase
VIRATPTLAELIGLYALHHPGLDAKSLAQYGYAVKSLERHYGYALRACDFSDDLLLPWLSARLACRAAKTVKRERGDLLTLWRFAYKRGLASVPPEDVPTVKVPRHNPNAWTPVEYAKLIAACHSLVGEMRGTGISKAIWWESLVTFLFHVGCRIGAALAVKSADVNLDRRIVCLRADAAKTGLEQVLVLHPQAVAAVARVWASDREYVWPYPYTPRRIWEHYKRLLAAAGLPTDRTSMFQRTRRTTYTLCVKFGSKEIASRQLGHKTDMSRFYLDESQLHPTQAADLLPAI